MQRVCAKSLLAPANCCHPGNLIGGKFVHHLLEKKRIHGVELRGDKLCIVQRLITPRRLKHIRLFLAKTFYHGGASAHIQGREDTRKRVGQIKFLCTPM